MKYLLLFAFIYFAYRLFFSNKALNQGQKQRDQDQLDKGDYTDYEELK